MIVEKVREYLNYGLKERYGIVGFKWFDNIPRKLSIIPSKYITTSSRMREEILHEIFTTNDSHETVTIKNVVTSIDGKDSIVSALQALVNIPSIINMPDSFDYDNSQKDYNS